MIKKYYLKIKEGIAKELKDNNYRDIAFSFAIGVFYGVMPTFSTAIIFAVITAKIFNTNKIIAALGTFISNPITAPFFYSFGAFVGSKFAGIKLNQIDMIKQILSYNWNILLLRFFLGYILTALLWSFLAYIFLLYILQKKKKK